MNRGSGRAPALTPVGRSTHLYVCGGSGVGKSKLLEFLIRQDIKAWPESRSGLLLLDPHGSVYHNVVDWMAENGTAALKRPVVLVDLARQDSVVAYNVLRRRDQASRSVIVDALVEAIAHVWGAANTTATPLFARWASNLLTLLYENPPPFHCTATPPPSSRKGVDRGGDPGCLASPVRRARQPSHGGVLPALNIT